VLDIGEFLSLLETIWMSLSLHRLFVRGGVTRGWLVHMPDLVFGEALIDAYELQSRHAAVPRVLVSRAVADGLASENAQAVATDTDGWSYVNVFSVGVGPFVIDGSLKEYCAAMVSKSDDVRIQEKYAWLVAKLDAAENEFGWLWQEASRRSKKSSANIAD
jgi:hypothetical protein